MIVNGSSLLGMQSKPSKELLNVEWVQREVKIPALQFLSVMVAIMDSVLICLCQKGIWFQEIWPWMGVDMLFVLLFIYFPPVIWIPSIWWLARTYTHTHTFKQTYKMPGYTLIEPAQHMWQNCPCLAPLSCPSYSHRAMTLVSSSYTLLESQHLSGDGLTLLSDTL